jgi:hypothetical protein
MRLAWRYNEQAQLNGDPGMSFRAEGATFTQNKGELLFVSLHAKPPGQVKESTTSEDRRKEDRTRKRWNPEQAS